jgi:hypothetical protein
LIVLARRTALAVSVALVAGIAVSAFANSNTVPASRLKLVNVGTIGPNQLRPPECASLNLTSLVTGSGIVTGPVGGGALILASSGVDTITSLGGGNCLVGGAGRDKVTATKTPATDICILSSVATHKNCATVVIRP